MRVLHLGKYYPPAPGGIESHVQTLARHQARLGCQVRVLCVNHADAAGKNITHSRLTPTRSLVEADGPVQVERVGRWFGVSRLEVCPTLLGKVKRATRDADIVHLHTPNPLMLGAWWASGSRDKPLVVTHHSDVIKQRLLRYAVAPFESAVYRAARLILTTSPKYLEESAQLRPYRDKTQPLPLAIDLDPLLSPQASILALGEELRQAAGDAPLWLMVGRLTYYKGYHVAIEALAKVPGMLVVVGNGPLESELREQARKMGVLDRIDWKPHVGQDELIALYHAATALWFPSVAKSEGFGLVQVEAMASGCPVINTHIPGSGVSWVSPAGVSGLTVAVGDPLGFAAAANRLAIDHPLRADLSKGARQRAKDLFEASQMAEKSLELYHAVLDLK